MVIKTKIPCVLVFSRKFGALTAKDYEFRARPWEIQSAIFFDKTEIGNPKLRVDFRDLKVLRVLPQIIPGQVNWITDRTRFYYNGYNSNRLVQCNLKIKNSYFMLSSENLNYWLNFLFLKIKTKTRKTLLNYFFENRANLSQNFNFIVYLNVLIHFKVVLNLKNSLSQLGLKNKTKVKIDTDFINFSNADLKSLVVNFKKIFLVNLDIRLSYPKLYLLLRNQTRAGTIIYTVGTRLAYSFNNFFLGIKINLLKKILTGRHWLITDVLPHEWKILINDNLCKINSKKISNVFYLMVNNCVEMSHFFGLANQMNILLNKFHENWINNKMLIFLFQNNGIPKLKKNAIKIFAGAHVPEIFEFEKLDIEFNIQVPLLSPLEQDENFISNTGAWFKTTKIISRMEFFFLDNSLSISRIIFFKNMPGGVALKSYLSKFLKHSVIFFDKTGFLFNLPPRASEVLSKLQIVLKKTSINYRE